MYKTRFTSWKLEKNMTKKRVINREEQSHTSVSAIDRSREKQKLVNYLRRLPKERCVKFFQAYEHSLEEVLSPQKALYDTFGIPIALSLPVDLLFPEYFIYLLNSHVRGSVEAKLWPRDESTGLKNEDIVPTWCSSIMTAGVILQEGKNAEALKFLLQFIKASPEQLVRQDPLIIVFVFTSVLGFASHRPDIARWLLNAMCMESEKIANANPSYSLRALFRIMRYLGPQQIIIHASRILLAYIDIIQSTLGGAYPIVQDMMSDAIWRLLHYDLLDPELVLGLGRYMVDKAKLQKHDRCKDHLNLMMSLANANLKLGRTHEARIITTEIEAAQAEGVFGRHMLPSLYMYICRIDEAESKTEQAICSVQKAITVSIEIFGRSSAWHLNTQIMYREVLGRANISGEEARAADDCDATIDELSSTLEWLDISEDLSVV